MKRRIFSAWVATTVLIATLMLLAAPNARAQIIYSNGFSNPVGSEWSSTLRSTTPVGGRQFLGEFGNQSVSLTLLALPAHSQLTVSFDLFILKSWDGGHDVFDLSVQGGSNLLHASFANNSAVEFQTQSYPGTFPGSTNAAWTGAAETNTLGYSFTTIPTSTFSDSVYRVSFTFSHAANTVILNFSSNLDQTLNDESWGIDNVVVAVPEPSSLTLCGLAAISLMALQRQAINKVNR